MGLCVLEGQGYGDGFDAGFVEGRSGSAYAYGSWTTSRGVDVLLSAGTYKFCIVMGSQSNAQTCSIRDVTHNRSIASVSGDPSTYYQNHASGSFTLTEESYVHLQANCYDGYSLVTVIPSEGAT